MAKEGSAKPQRKKRLAFTALEIADQVYQVRDWIGHGKRAHEIRRLCAERWGLDTRVAERRMTDARRAMVQDADALDRQELAAQAMETLLKVQEQSLDTRQGSNAIGATRLLLELAGIIGRTS